MTGMGAALDAMKSDAARSRDGQVVWRQIELFGIVLVAIVVAVAYAPIDSTWRARLRTDASEAPEHASAQSTVQDRIKRAPTGKMPNAAPPSQPPQRRSHDQPAAPANSATGVTPARLLMKTVGASQAEADDLKVLTDPLSQRMPARAMSSNAAGLNMRRLLTARGAPHTGPPQ